MLDRKKILVVADEPKIVEMVDAHVKNLRQNIESNSKESQYILTVHGVRYRLGGI